jgi:membrane-bound lytic murein transglycosylase MltF
LNGIRRTAARVSVIWLVAVACAAAPASAQSAPTDRYDDTFRKYAKRFFGVGFDWRLFKAQAIVESNLDPNAKSRAGARGIMQLMPATLREVRSKNPDLRATMSDIEHNIAAGIGHARQLWVLWRDDSHEPDRPRFMLGSYNAGRGTVLRAQQTAQERGLDERLWPSIESVAPNVPRWRYTETLTYVERVLTYHLLMDPRGRLKLAK